MRRHWERGQEARLALKQSINCPCGRSGAPNVHTPIRCQLAFVSARGPMHGAPMKGSLGRELSLESGNACPTIGTATGHQQCAPGNSGGGRPPVCRCNNTTGSQAITHNVTPGSPCEDYLRCNESTLCLSVSQFQQAAAEPAARPSLIIAPSAPPPPPRWPPPPPPAAPWQTGWLGTRCCPTWDAG